MTELYPIIMTVWEAWQVFGLKIGQVWTGRLGFIMPHQKNPHLLYQILNQILFAEFSYSLYQNYPNPFNPVTKITYSIQKSDIVNLNVYDILGREIQIIVNKLQKANTYSVNFDASNLSSGIYFYRLQVGNDFKETKKMLLLR